MLALVTLVALLGSLLAVVSPPQPAHAEVTGTGGQYVPMNEHARVYDGATSSDSFKTVQIAGVDGLPTSGIGAVSLMLTVVNPNGQGQFVGRPDADGSNTLLMIYGAGVDGNTSNTSLMAVGDDGKIRINTQTSQSRVVIDVTGYYTSTANGVGAGGFVPVSSKRIVNTGTATNAPQGPLTNGKSFTFTAAGVNGVPANAAAVAINVIVNNTSTVAGWVRPFPAGSTDPSGALNYGPTGGLSTAMSAQVGVGSGGKITIDTSGNGSSVNVIVDVQGYFMPSNPGGGFTPQTGRLIDTRSGSAVASNGSLAVQIAGAKSGIPSVEGGLSAVAITLTEVHQGSDGGYAKAWADGAPEPDGSIMDYSRNTQTRTTTATIPVGANGKIRIKNVSAAATDFVVDLQGTYNSLPGGPSNTNRTGQRKSATTLPFNITDQTSASVDVGTGNLMVATSALSAPGVASSMKIGASYNSRATNTANSNTMDANRWQYALAGAGNLSANSAGVVYTDAAGTAWLFKPNGSQGAFTTPAGIQQTLTRVNTSGTNYEYTLKGWTSNQVIHFNLAGQPTSIVDRNSNQTSFNTSDGYRLNTLVSNAGATGAKTIKATYANGTQTFTQTNGTSTRSVSWTKNSAGDVTTYTDALGKKTIFGYTSGDLTSITAPGGGVTVFAYDSSDRVTSVQQRNSTAGSPGTAITRLSYTSDTQTLVAGPRTDQTAAVASVPHTTYTLNSNDLVTKAVDAAKREQSRDYNPSNNGVSASTTGVAGSADASTSTGTYGANNKQSLTQVQSASGSSSSSSYATGANAYRPADAKDSAGNSQQYTYSGVGNQLSTKSGSGDNAATASLEYNSDGTVKTATAPGNDGNPTKYAYDGNKQLQTITAPSGTKVGPKNFTYDAFARVKTETDGRGNTTTFGYDNDDRLTSTSFSDGTATVTNTYDSNGNRTQQVSAGGTITSSYDQQNRLIATQNTAGGGQVQYSYDLAGNTATVTDAHGKISHEYDQANALTATTYPTSTGTARQLYWTDDHGRRTDTWLAAVENEDPTQEPTSWAAHQKLTYDKSGKVTRVQAWAADANPQLVVDTTYCYLDGIAVGAACTATDGTDDRDQIQWSKDNITQQTTDYDYTVKNKDGSTATTTRLQKVTQAGGGKNSTWTYTYDAAGNRLTATATGDTSSSQTLTFNAVGQITSDGYAYDATGNMVAAPDATFTYNAAQQMTSSTKNGKKTTYTYAGGDMNKLLAQSTDDGPSYRYTYGTGITSRELVGTGTASIISDPSTGQPLDLQTTDGTTTMWVLDGIGNPVTALADTGETAYAATYDPYGAETVTTGGDSAQWQQNPFGFKGGLRSGEANGLTKFGARWQSPSTSGWIQRDTMDAPLDPSNANRYAYAGDDPVNGSDPTGRWVNASFNICAVVCGSVGRSQYGSDYSLTGSYGVSTSKGPGLSLSWGSGAPENDIGWSTDYSAGPLTASQNDSGDWSYSLDPTVTGLGVGIGRSYTATQQVKY